MNDLKIKKLKEKVTKSLPGYDKYCKLNEEFIIKLKNNEYSPETKEGIKKLSNTKKDILKSINNILFEKGLEVQVDNVEKGIQMIMAFCLDDYYFNNDDIPTFINERLKDNYYDDCYNGYLMVLEFARKGMINESNIYNTLTSSFTYLYDLIVDVYKENGTEGLGKYIKILDLFRKNFNTCLSAINVDERFKKYVIYLTSNNSLLNALSVYDLYLIMLCFCNNEFLNLIVKTNGNVLNDIASLIIRRKKDGITKEDELKQLMYFSKNIGIIPTNEEKSIKL